MTVQQRRFRLPWQRSLQGRLTLISLLFALVPLIIVAVLIFSQAQSSLFNQEASNVQAISEATGTSVEEFFTTSAGQVKVLAQSSILTSPDSTPEQKVALLRSVLTSSPYYKSIYVTDLTGQVVASADQTGGDQSRQDWFKSASQGQTFVSDVYYLTAVQDYVVTFSAPIYSPQGKPLGVVAVHFAAQSLFDLVAARKFGQNGEVQLVDSAGRDIADVTQSDIFSDLSNLPAVQAGLAGRSGSVVGFDPNQNIPVLFS